MQLHLFRACLACVVMWLTVLAVPPTAYASDCAPADIAPPTPGGGGDDQVNVDDLLAVINAWGPCTGCAADIAPPTIGDGQVNVDDLLAVINAWGPTGFDGGTFPAQWIFGGPGCAPPPGGDPSIQVHQYNENTYILRQSLCTNFEGPFVYLLFGQTKVLMQDTGASNVPMAATVYGIINQWLAAHKQASIQLIVTHSHAHGDHIFCDGQFNGQPNTTVVGTSVTAVQNFFGITSWPTQIVTYDLGGGRVLDVIPIPGHHPAHIALYDRDTDILFTGDTLYPGRLYISSFSQYMASIQRLVGFTQTPGKPICHVLGTHIEMSNVPGDDYPIGSTYHPNEHPLGLGLEHLLELNAAIIAMQAAPHIEVHDEFIIWPF
jgi:hydroxyacylglutathione hydrolase